MNIRADHDRLKKYNSTIFESIGLSREYADIIADNLVTAEMRGIRSHGLVQVKNYVDLYNKGTYNKAPKVCIIKEDAATALIDADRGAGAPIGKYAVDKAIEKAKAVGISALQVSGCYQHKDVNQAVVHTLCVRMRAYHPRPEKNQKIRYPHNERHS